MGAIDTVIINWIDLLWQLLHFLSAGGYVLLTIFVLNLIIWTLMLERFWYFEKVYPGLFRQTLEKWQTFNKNNTVDGARSNSMAPTSTDFHNMSYRNMIIAQLKNKLNKHLSMIHTFVELLPILGLMGTIIGMIEMFEVLNLYGTGNARALADSISKTLVTTLAGLLSAIPGLFLISLLQQKAHSRIEQLTDKLSFNNIVVSQK